jgi:hypothetical protein
MKVAIQPAPLTKPQALCISTEAGFELRERLPGCPEYVREADWVPESLRRQGLRWIDEDGFGSACA